MTCSIALKRGVSRIEVLAVRVVERRRDGASVVNGFFKGEVVLPVETLSQRLAFYIGHDIVENPVGDSGIEQWKNVRVVESGGELDLPPEALGSK